MVVVVVVVAAAATAAAIAVEFHKDSVYLSTSALRFVNSQK